MIAGVEPLNCGCRVVGSLLLLLAISEIIPDLAGILGNCRMSQFIHYVRKKPLLFVLLLVGHDQRSFSLQINYINSIVGKGFFHDIISFYITIAYGIIAFSILV